jgi:hypothetical protein
MDTFAIAHRAASSEEQDVAPRASSITRDRDLNTWFDNHAQITVNFRASYFEPELLPVSRPDLDLLRSVSRLEKELFTRDGYRCRYCNV